MAVAPALSATTLLRLTVNEMVAHSTDIVRGKVRDCQASPRGAFVVTQCIVQVSERLKGKTAALMTVTIPGGKVAGSRLRHVIAGAPELDSRAEYLLFLWTGSNGLTQLIGLSQGVLEIQQTATGPVATRSKIQGTGFAGASGKEVADDGLTVSLEAVRRQVKLTGAAR